MERAQPILAAMGQTITHVARRRGQAVKAINQVVLSGAYLGVAEGMVLALKAGLDPVGRSPARSAGVRPGAGCWRTGAGG